MYILRRKIKMLKKYKFGEKTEGIILWDITN
jgi:hypothetical protein